MKTLYFLLLNTAFLLTCFGCKKSEDQLSSEEIQVLLDNEASPFDLLERNVPVEDLYGKIYLEGFIFYIDEENEVGMVVSMNDLVESKWGCEWDVQGLNNVANENQNEEEAGARIGDGNNNTNAILETCTNGAAVTCKEVGGEWYMPSRGELMMMYTNLQLRDIGNISAEMFQDYYWSSTEHSSNNGWVVEFSTGRTLIEQKMYFHHVRAVRNF